MKVPSPSYATSTAPENSKSVARAKQVAQQFESLFVSMMFKSMRATIGDNPLSSTAEKMYTDMLDTEYAGLTSRTANLGLAQQILENISRNGGADAQAALAALKNLKNAQTAATLNTSANAYQASSSHAQLKKNAQNYMHEISQAAEEFNVDPNLITSVISAESAGNPYAISRVGAKGLMQLMDSTARDMGVRRVFDPADNIRGGTRYLKAMLDKYDGNVDMALAAYNAGPSAVDKHNGIPPYKETQEYVAKIRLMHANLTDTNKLKD